MQKRDEVTIKETVKEYRKRKGAVRKNDVGKITLWTFVNCSDQQRGRGYLYSIGNKKALPSVTIEQTKKLLSRCSEDDIIVEVYPTRFCLNKRCGKASWSFVDFPQQGHSTCTKCGTTAKLVQHKFSRHFDKGLDNGSVNKNMYNHTEGMDVNDTCLTKGGKHLRIGGQRIKSHQRHYWAVVKKISNIASNWHWTAMELIETRAKKKAKTFYYSIHREDIDDNQIKMPHGQAQFAAACLYAAVLEFEYTRKCKTNCTLSTIREEAQHYVDKSKNRKTRDVTIEVIIKYVKKLKSARLCQAPIPELTANTLRFRSKNLTLEHARLAILNQCKLHRVVLPSKESWGITVGDSERGILIIESVRGGSHAFNKGIQKGDYLFQIEERTLGVEYTIQDFENFVIGMRKNPKCPNVGISIMRRKK